MRGCRLPTRPTHPPPHTLQANELSISLVAAIPALAFAGASIFYMGRWVTPTPPDPRWEALPVRMAMTEVERALSHLAALEEERRRTAAAAAAPPALGGPAPAEAEPGPGAKLEVSPAAPAPVAQAAGSMAEEQGLLAWRLAIAYSEAGDLYRRHRGLVEISSRSEWPNLRGDLLELASPLSPLSHRLRTAQRVMRTYGIFQHF